MSYYRTCEYCGSNLDPAEVCDCREERKKDMNDDTLMIMGTIENANQTMKEIKSILENVSSDLHDMYYSTLMQSGHDDEDNTDRD